MRKNLTSKQIAIVARITADRVGGTQFTLPGDQWRTAFAFTAWELYRV